MNDDNSLFVLTTRDPITVSFTDEAGGYACDSYSYVFSRIAQLQLSEAIANNPALDKYQVWAVEEGKQNKLRLSCYCNDVVIYSETINYFIYPLLLRYDVWREAGSADLMVGLEGQYKGLKS